MKGSISISILFGFYILDNIRYITCEHNKCAEFSEAMAQSIEYYVNKTVVFDQPHVRESLSKELGIDVLSPSQVKKLACSILEVKSIKELASILGPDIQSLSENFLKQYYDEKKNAIDLRMKYERLELMVCSVSKGWFIGSGFPNFPLGIDYDFALSSQRTLHHYINGETDESFAELVATALVESKSLDDYASALGIDSEDLWSTIKFVESVDTIAEGVKAYQKVLDIAREVGLFTLPIQ